MTTVPETFARVIAAVQPPPTGAFVVGSTWTNATGNLPNVMVVDLVFQTSTKQLFAATYGRSIWRLQLT